MLPKFKKDIYTCYLNFIHLDNFKNTCLIKDKTHFCFFKILDLKSVDKVRSGTPHL